MNPTTIPLENVLASVEFAIGPLVTSPLMRPLKRLAEDLNALVREGHLLEIELDLQHPDCPCFLLNVAPDAPKFYVELFINEPFFDEMFEDGEGTPLNILMNWMGSDTEPAFWYVRLLELLEHLFPAHKRLGSQFANKTIGKLINRFGLFGSYAVAILLFRTQYDLFHSGSLLIGGQNIRTLPLHEICNQK